MGLSLVTWDRIPNASWYIAVQESNPKSGNNAELQTLNPEYPHKSSGAKPQTLNPKPKILNTKP